MDEPADPRPGEARSTIELARMILATPREPFFSPLPKLRERPCQWGEEQRFAQADPTFLAVALRVKAWGPVASESMNRPEERMDEQNEYRDPAPPVNEPETMADRARRVSQESRSARWVALARDVRKWADEAGPKAVDAAMLNGLFGCEVAVPREFFGISDEVVRGALLRWAAHPSRDLCSTVTGTYRLTWNLAWAVRPSEMPKVPEPEGKPTPTLWEGFWKKHSDYWNLDRVLVILAWALAAFLALLVFLAIYFTAMAVLR